MSRNTSETDGHIQASNLCSGAWDDDLSCFLSGVSALKLCFAFVLLFTISSSCIGNESRSLGTSGFSGDTEASWQQNFLNARMQRSSKSEAAGIPTVGIMSQGRGGALRPGFRKVLAQRLFELEHTTRDDATQLYNDHEGAAFERGYRAAVQDVLVLVGAALAGAAFLTVCLSPALYQKVREKVRPWVVRQVELGRPWVIWIQRFRHPLLDRVHLLAANSCGDADVPLNLH
eukprot:s1288_g6.t1